MAQQKCVSMCSYDGIVVALFCEQSLSCGIEQTIVWQERCFVGLNGRNQIGHSNNTESHGNGDGDGDNSNNGDDGVDSTN